MNALEQAFDDAAGPLIEQCPACGGPSHDAPGILSLGLREVVPTCSECGKVVDKDGHTIVKILSGVVQPVIICRR